MQSFSFRAAFVSVVNAFIAYFCMSLNIIGKTYAMLSFNMPSIFGAFFSTGEVKAVVVVALLIVLDMLMYYPFVKFMKNSS